MLGSGASGCYLRVSTRVYETEMCRERNEESMAQNEKSRPGRVEWGKFATNLK